MLVSLMLLSKIKSLNKLGAGTWFILIALFVCSEKIDAQPNGGFENWTSEFSYEVPDSWQTLNFLSMSTPPVELSAFKAIGLDKHSGNYALKLKTVLVDEYDFPELLGDSIGGAYTGKINFSPFFYQFGFPYTGRPEKLEFWAKYSPVGNDTAAAAVVLRRWNGFGHDTIAVKIINILPSPVYTQYHLDVEYNLNALPDSAVIAFYPSKDSVVSRINSTLFVDDVAFTGWVGINDKEKTDNRVKVFPNPAKNQITILASDGNSERIRIRNMSGKEVFAGSGIDHKFFINTTEFAPGLYFFELMDNTNNVSRHGKFNIIR